MLARDAEQEHHQPEGGTADQPPQQRVDVERPGDPSGDVVEHALPDGSHRFVAQRPERAVRLEDEVADEADAHTDDGVEAGPVVVCLVEEEVGADPERDRQRDGERDLERRLGDVARADVVEEEGARARRRPAAGARCPT